MYPVCDILTKLVHKSTNSKTFRLIIAHVQSKISLELDTPEAVFNLWLEGIKRYNGEDLNTHWVDLLSQHSSKVEQECPGILCEILQEYMLLGLVRPSI